mmetsp:Transcript_11974/g.25924  ORF Transcript_11974/g.25924 Transcript_11974/m.25924 type:complete len:86 (+) Transcript_11974:39-296(+)
MCSTGKNAYSLSLLNFSFRHITSAPSPTNTDTSVRYIARKYADRELVDAKEESLLALIASSEGKDAIGSFTTSGKSVPMSPPTSC